MNSFELLPIQIVAVYVFLFGLCVGSFLNVVILRGLSGEDFVFERSKCPKCQKQLKWYMNIPLLSYVFLRGKCAFCKSPISIQYPVVELITALLFLAIFFTFGLTLKTLLLFIIVSLFIVLCTTDILETVIITNHAYILTVFGVIYSILNLSEISVIESILAAISGFIAFELISRIGYLFANMRMFGQGDSYIALGIGSVFGFKGLIIITILSFLLQSIVALPVIIKSSFKEKKTKLAISYILVALSILYTLFINVVNLNNYSFYVISALILVIVLIYCLKNILSEMKTKKELMKNVEKNTENLDDDEFERGKNIFLLMPFGPALIVTSLFYLFFSKLIKKLLTYILF